MVPKERAERKRQLPLGSNLNRFRRSIMAKQLTSRKRTRSRNRHLIVWGSDTANPTIERETPEARRVQALRWRQLADAIAELRETAGAIVQWREEHHPVIYGAVGISTLAARAADLSAVIADDADVVVNLSPTLRSSLATIQRAAQ
jgi:hypothetical protein